jgi:hypothetical protein
MKKSAKNRRFSGQLFDFFIFENRQVSGYIPGLITGG